MKLQNVFDKHDFSREKCISQYEIWIYMNRENVCVVYSQNEHEFLNIREKKLGKLNTKA